MPEEAQLDEIKAPPFLSNAISEVQRLSKFARMTDLGFTLGSRLSSLLQIFRARLKDFSSMDSALDWLQEMADELQPYAEDETATDMAYLKGLVTIRYVTVLETAVQDAVTYSLEHVPAVFEHEQLRRLKGPIVEILAASPAERSEFIAAALAQETKASLQIGVGRFETLLEPVGLGGAVDNVARRVLLELLQVRNVLVHKNGRVDNRLTKQCPWLGLAPGAQLRVTFEMAGRYKSAVLYYLSELGVRWFRRSISAADVSSLELARDSALNNLNKDRMLAE